MGFVSSARVDANTWPRSVIEDRRLGSASVPPKSTIRGERRMMPLTFVRCLRMIPEIMRSYGRVALQARAQHGVLSIE